MDSVGGVEMDLSTRSREEACKMRVAKSVFSIRSLVDLGDAADKSEQREDTLNGAGELF